MELTQLQLFQQYKKAHPEHPVCLKAFEKLKPIYVKKVSERETCCCIYHMKLEYARVGLNALRSAKTGFHGDGCKCCCEVCGPGEKCMASQHTYDSSSELWRAVVCNKIKGEEWYKHDCLMQKCQKCGIQSLPICPREREDHEFLLEWKTFEKTLLQIPMETEEAGGAADCVTKEVPGGSRKKRTNATKKGNKSKKSKVAGGTQSETAAQDETSTGKGKKKKEPKPVLRLSYKRTSVKDFISYLCSTLKIFVPHNYRARWQAMQFRLCLDSIQDSTVVSVIDFAENYSIKIQREVQSQHWHNDQITILVHITYRIIDKSSGVRKLLKETHFYLSDDKNHDSLFVQHCLRKHNSWLVSNGVEFSKHIVWSDGCSSQFKSARPFYFLPRYHHELGKEIVWNFFGTTHGKGEHDGQGAVLKGAFTREQLKYEGVRFRGAADACEFATRWNEGTNNGDIKRYFWYIGKDDVDRTYRLDCARVVGTKEIHSIRTYMSKSTTRVAHRGLNCFCGNCLKGNWSCCVNRLRLKSWKYVTLQPMKSTSETHDDEIDEAFFEGDGEWLSGNIEEGDNFAVVAEEGNKENAEFYVVKCVKPRHILDKIVHDSWGQTFNVDEHVLAGVYYSIQPDGSWELLQNNRLTYQYSHLVTAIKLEMNQIPDTNRFSLDRATHQMILDSLPYEG